MYNDFSISRDLIKNLFVFGIFKKWDVDSNFIICVIYTYEWSHVGCVSIRRNDAMATRSSLNIDY